MSTIVTGLYKNKNAKILENKGEEWIRIVIFDFTLKKENYFFILHTVAMKKNIVK